jgi:hypothetical protein
MGCRYCALDVRSHHSLSPAPSVPKRSRALNRPRNSGRDRRDAPCGIIAPPLVAGAAVVSLLLVGCARSPRAGAPTPSGAAPAPVAAASVSAVASDTAAYRAELRQRFEAGLARGGASAWAELRRQGGGQQVASSVPTLTPDVARDVDARISRAVAEAARLRQQIEDTRRGGGTPAADSLAGVLQRIGDGAEGFGEALGRQCRVLPPTGVDPQPRFGVDTAGAAEARARFCPFFPWC